MGTQAVITQYIVVYFEHVESNQFVTMQPLMKFHGTSIIPTDVLLKLPINPDDVLIKDSNTGAISVYTNIHADAFKQFTAMLALIGTSIPIPDSVVDVLLTNQNYRKPVIYRED